MPAPEPPPKQKDISNVVFYLTNGESLVGVKLDYTIETNDYLQPATLISQIEAAVNASAKLDGYEVVGYRLKAGLQDFDFGTTYDDFGTTGGNRALAEGMYNGKIQLKASEIDGLKPIDLDLANPADVEPAMLGAGDLLDSSIAEKTDTSATPEDPSQPHPEQTTTQPIPILTGSPTRLATPNLSAPSAQTSSNGRWRNPERTTRSSTSA
jgi:hypothetical protein